MTVAYGNLLVAGPYGFPPARERRENEKGLGAMCGPLLPWVVWRRLVAVPAYLFGSFKVPRCNPRCQRRDVRGGACAKSLPAPNV